jgi:hypothetical protein
MDLPKLGIRDTYLFKPKWLKKNTEKVHFKGEYPRKDISRLEDQEGVRKNRKIVHLGKNENQMISSLAGSKRREDFRRKIREYQKIP